MSKTPWTKDVSGTLLERVQAALDQHDRDYHFYTSPDLLTDLHAAVAAEKKQPAKTPAPTPSMTIDELCKEAHETAKSKGWWESDRPVMEQLMLFVTEVAEAAEEYRNGKPLTEIYYDPNSDTPCKPLGFPIELADILIRVGDTCARYGIDLESALRIKMDYNRTRPHRHGGKKA